MRNVVLYLILCVFVLQCRTALAEVRYLVEIDGRKSTQIGAENLIAFQYGTSSMLDRYLKPRWFEEDKKSRKAIGIFYRLSKTVLLDNVIDHLAILTQHEVFGHGSRYREFGYKNNSYSLSLFPPYGNGNGYAISGGAHLK